MVLYGYVPENIINFLKLYSSRKQTTTAGTAFSCLKERRARSPAPPKDIQYISGAQLVLNTRFQNPQKVAGNPGS
jgi:hypothetical protein